MTGLFHGAAEAGRVRDACMTARSLVQIAELVAKIADAIPHPPTAPVQSLFSLAGQQHVWTVSNRVQPCPIRTGQRWSRP